MYRPDAKSSILSAFSLAVSQSRFPCPDDRLRPIGHLQLAEDVGNVVAHRLEGEAQLLGDLLIGFPLGDQCQEFALPLAEFWEDPRRDARPVRREEAEHTPGNAGAEDGP